MGSLSLATRFRSLGQVLSVALVASLIVINPASPSTSAQAASTPTEDQFIDMQPNSILSSATAPAISLNSPLTVEAWINPDTADGIWAHLFDLSATQEFYVKLGFSGAGDTTGDLYAYVHNGGNHQPCGEVLTGRWTHVAVTYAADAVSCYVNGALSGTVSNGVVTTTPMIQMGKYRGATNDPLDFPGGIDQVKLWTKTLSTAEVNASMHSWGSPTSDLSGNPLNISSSLKHHYDFNAGSGPVEDLVGSADLSITGTTSFLNVTSTALDGNDVVVTFPRTYLTSQGGWSIPSDLERADVLVVGGGGGGAGRHGGGGGAGGFLTGTNLELPAATYSVVVGTGGLGAPQAVSTSDFPYIVARAGSGGTSSAFGLVAKGGGAGGGWGSWADRVGGSGGGGGFFGESGGSGEAGQGFAGGRGSGGDSNNSPNYGGGGGGGAGGSGSAADGNAGSGGNGGPGTTSSITGATLYYAAGGGGGATLGTGGSGGSSKGGNGSSQSAGFDGANLTGSGGGGGGLSASIESHKGGNGGSGVVILRYTPQNTITFQSFGTSELDPITVNTGSAVSKPADPTTSSEAIFLGWTTTQGDASTLVSWPYTLSDSATLYGLWASSPGLNSEIDYAGSISAALLAVSDSNQIRSSTSFTIQLWVKPTAGMISGAQDYPVAVKQFDYAIVARDGKWQYLLSQTNNDWSERVDTGRPVVAGAWVHLALVKNSSGSKFFIDGQEVTSDSSVYTATDHEDLQFGASAAGQLFDAQLDEIRIWHSDRTDQMVDDMHSKVSRTETGLQAYWDFNEGTGAAVSDRVAGQNLSVVSGSLDFADVKLEVSTSYSTIITFPRTYLSGLGGWTVPAGIEEVSALVVGGGGGGGSNAGSGGGGGGVFYKARLDSSVASTASIKVGLGGLAGNSPDVSTAYPSRNGGTGGTSSMALGNQTFISNGGQGGLTYWSNLGCDLNTPRSQQSNTQRLGGTISSGEDGGGSGGVGGAAASPSGTGGNGGAGHPSSISGQSLIYGAGGGAGNFSGAGGGIGGGIASSGAGNGGSSFADAGSSAVNNRGGGGGGGAVGCGLGGAGGSGVVILSYETAFVSVSSLVNQTALSSRTASFTIATTGSTGTLTYQWQVDSGSGFLDISGATSATYTTPALTLSDNGNQYRVVVTSNVNGTSDTTTSPAATLTVNNIFTERLMLDYQASDINSFDPAVFPNSVSDLAGNYNAIVSGSSQVTLSDQSFAFDGNGGFIDVAGIPSSQTFSEGITVDFIADFGDPDFWERIFDFGNGAVTNNIFVAREALTSNLAFEVDSATNNFALVIFNNAILPGLNRYTLTADGTNIRLYTNGTLTSTIAKARLPLAVNRPSSFLGKSNWSSDANFEGRIQHLRIFNAAFSSSQLSEFAVSYRNVSFESNGGTSYSPVSTSGTLRLPSPAKVNSNFLGWFTSSNFVTPALGATYSPMASGSLYAQWIIPTFTLTLDNEGVTTTQTVALGSNPTDPAIARANFTLVGWSDDNDSSAEYSPTLSDYVMGSANDTIYAVWVSDFVNLSVGNCSMSVSRTVGVTITEMPGGACKVEFASAGSYNWKVPANVSSLEALLVGGGGGGAAGRGGSWYGGGAGGGGGASTKVSLAVTTSQEIPLTVGAGGVAGTGASSNTVTATSHGGNGGSSSFSGSDVVAPGGLGGSASAALSTGGAGGAGGVGSGTVLSGGTGGKGADGIATRTWERPTAGGSARSLTLGGENYCLGGGGGGGNRGVDGVPHFFFQAQGGGCTDTGLSSGGAGRYYSGSTYLGAVPGVANTGGGGGGGSYTSGGGTSGAAGATGLVAIYYVPGAGSVALSQPADRDYVADQNVSITLTKESPGTASWTSSNTAICTVSGTDSSATAVVKGTGVCDVSVTVAQAGGFNTGSAQVSFNIAKITRSGPSWDNANISAPFGSTVDLYEKLNNPSGAADYSFTTSGTGCVVTGASLNVGDAGSSCSVTPTLLGSNIYLPAAGSSMTVNVSKISQSGLVLTNATTMKVNETLTLSAAGGSGTGALSYSKDSSQADSATCTVNSSTGALIAAQAGTCWVYATRALSTNYDAVTSSAVLITVEKISQVLQFVSQPQASYVAGNTYQVEATASSQLSAVYSIGSGIGSVCSIAADTITFLGTGNCEIRAAQLGNGSYFAAQTISQIVSVGLINQSITFSAITNKVWGSIAFNLTATVSSNLSIAYAEDVQTTNDACDVTVNGVVSIKNVGRCAITATQAGDSRFAQVAKTQVFEVVADQAGAPFIGSVSFGDRQLTAAFFKPSYLGGGTVSAYELRAYELDGTLASSNTGCTPGAGTTNSCTVIGLTNGTPYVLRVAAVTQAGVGALSPSSSQITPASNPEAVGNLTAIEGNGSLTLNWTQPTSLGGGTFDQYRIFWKAPGGSYQPNGSPGASVGTFASTSFVITGLQNGVSYDVKVTTVTSNNTQELQSNTAEVNQTPYTVPDAPASVVALDNGSTVVIAWQPPTFDGGNPIDQYVVKKGGSTVCTITSVSTTSCEVAKPAPGTSNIEVRAGNDAGLSLPAQTTFTVQSVAGSNNQIVAGSGGISLPGVTPTTPRPIVTDVSGSAVVSENDLVRLTGTNMRLVQKVLVADVEASFFINSDSLITIRVPMGVSAGKVVVTLSGAFGSVFFADLVEVRTLQQSIDSKVTIGTFLGFAAVYTKNHEGKRLSMKIGNKWRVIQSLGSDYTYNLTKVGAGKTITVEVYLDRQLVQVKQIKVQ